MDELVEAAPATALEAPPLSPRPNQLFQGVLSFLAVVGIGSAVTLAAHPPVKLRVVTVEKRVAAAPPDKPLAPPAPAAVLPQRRPQPPPPHCILRHPLHAKLPLVPKSDDCKGDPLCGLDDLKR